MRTALPRLHRGHRLLQRDLALRCRSRCIFTAAGPRGVVAIPQSVSHSAQHTILEFRRLNKSTSKHSFSFTSHPHPSAREFATLRSIDDHDSISAPHFPQEIGDLTARFALLDKYLPRDLRINHEQYVAEEATEAHAQNTSKSCDEILTILGADRQTPDVGTDLMARMVLDGRKKAALHIVDMLLKNLVVKFPKRPPLQAPSNIPWPRQSLDTICEEPIELDMVVGTLHESLLPQRELEMDPRYTFSMSEVKDTTMTAIWVTLGRLVIESANMTDSDASSVLNVVMLILGQIHNLDLMPENVYTYRSSSFNSFLERPPILHLLSSRILTALSDAAWREQQNQMIEKVASSGVPYEEIAREAPGGRFRLKVRPLGPEMWLEFILWCCIEGGFASAGHRLIQALRSQDANPWFALSWTGNGITGPMTPRIDWDRVRLRSGGTVGRIEGYSRDKPLVEMPHRTISTEAILGLVSTSIETSDSGSVPAVQSESLQTSIVDMISFLEPLDLPLSYFDYLTVRLMQAGCFDELKGAARLDTWFEKVRHLKSLETVQPRALPRTTLDLDSLSAQSELTAGILHQALDAQVQSGNVHQALQTFNVLQQLVDESKLQAIGNFLDNTSQKQSRGFFSGKPYQPNRKDFVFSHGQLPLYKLTGLLDLATDTGLVGFGQWLLYSDAPDGPLIPESEFFRPSVAQAVLRFASLSNDSGLAERVSDVQRRDHRKKTIRTLEALAHADLAAHNFRGAETHLLDLKNSTRGGGLRTTTLALIAGTILKIEADNFYGLPFAPHRDRAISGARRLLHKMLRGDFHARASSYTLADNIAQRQQIAALLQMFLRFPESLIGKVASYHAGNYPPGNRPCLPTRTFNVFMEAVVAVKGSMAGARLWEQFCQDPATEHNEEYQDLVPFEAVLEDPVVQRSDDDTHADELSLAAEDLAENVTRGQSLSTRFRDAIPMVEANTDATTSSYRDHRGHHDQRHFSMEAGNLDDIDEQQDPVTIPNQRTLRLIVQRAVRDKQQTTTSRAQDFAEQDRVLMWAVKHYETFNLTREQIEFEIQARLHDQRSYNKDPAIPFGSVRYTPLFQRHDRSQPGKTWKSRGTSGVTAQFGHWTERQARMQARPTQDKMFKRWLT